jgi:hypothetical protein
MRGMSRVSLARHLSQVGLARRIRADDIHPPDNLSGDAQRLRSAATRRQSVLSGYPCRILVYQRRSHDLRVGLGVRQGGNKVMWIRPTSEQLVVTGQRLDAEGAPLSADIPCCYPSTFQASGFNCRAEVARRFRAVAGRWTSVSSSGEARAMSSSACHSPRGSAATAHARRPSARAERRDGVSRGHVAASGALLEDPCSAVARPVGQSDAPAMYAAPFHAATAAVYRLFDCWRDENSGRSDSGAPFARLFECVRCRRLPSSICAERRSATRRHNPRPRARCTGTIPPP